MKRAMLYLCVLSCLLSGCTHANAKQSGSKARRNEKIIYRYLTDEMGLSRAAACGVLANIHSESSFRPNVENDSGHYGLCQWGGVRRRRLIKYCRKKGYNYRTVSAQLRYMRFELRHYYPKVLKKLRSVRNSSRGAYKAGYYFCYHYEVPGNRARSSERRGSLARRYYKKY